ncbi:hypothetical protein [Halorubrum depositum]|uniref:hypothetical protein n=1 Tax=Halorubrum depositum TaxID=2583992 RepID=UPI0011A5A4E9|nr:hypothetical protein [Halorubrum depositum]
MWRALVRANAHLEGQNSDGGTLETKSVVAIAVIVLIATVGISGAALGVGPDAAPETGAAHQENPLETAVSRETTIEIQNDYDAQFEAES